MVRNIRRNTDTFKNGFGKKYQYSKNEFSKKCQYSKNECSAKNISTVRTGSIKNITTCDSESPAKDCSYSDDSSCPIMEKMLEKEVQELDNHPPLAAGER